jgi:hypothetical protein
MTTQDVYEGHAALFRDLTLLLTNSRANVQTLGNKQVSVNVIMTPRNYNMSVYEYRKIFDGFDTTFKNSSIIMLQFMFTVHPIMYLLVPFFVSAIIFSYVMIAIGSTCPRFNVILPKHKPILSLSIVLNLLYMLWHNTRMFVQ